MSARAVEMHLPVMRERNGAIISVGCTACGHASFAGTQSREFYERLFAEHAAQYAPGSAPDIEVTWHVEASCSVCPDGGMVTADADGVSCDGCGTCWDHEGRARLRQAA